MTTHLSDSQWEQYERDGYLHLGRVLSGEKLETLRNRIDEIMLGEAPVPYDRMMMQLDSETGAYDDIGPQTKGHKQATLSYRKIQDLELDPVFFAYIRHPLFRHICRRVYGPHRSICIFRAMFMNKPARRGTVLPWHQDRWARLDRDPLVTIWTALDPATKANGCVRVIPGSHQLGVVNPDHPSGFLTEEQADRYCPEEKTVFLELEAGEVVLLHNLLLHSSGLNETPVPRRAFSVCYMDADTNSTQGDRFTLVFERERESCSTGNEEIV